MRAAFIIACLSACLAPAPASASRALDGEPNQVPGDSPLVFCEGDHSKDIVGIERVDTIPNPPQPGQNLTISAQGVVHEPIEDGAYVRLIIKYNRFISIPVPSVNLCDNVGQIGLSCPLEAGEMKISKEFPLEKKIPPGTYDVQADVFTKDDRKITCVQASVEFKQSGFSNEL
ncbi:hypothetical protein CDD82_6652 [Ophiocordyceps australis]|uniref:Phosphatidylglycerol/phosphatidylinositol transfer protein n=1 Tax=Ophiocordyceps australis TaxID=1399860 RepID=A0A2C5ZQY9_9HYPO|nr:hypothetical protein CDD82_6652 [Ophiocordyceps australis]